MMTARDFRDKLAYLIREDQKAAERVAVDRVKNAGPELLEALRHLVAAAEEGCQPAQQDLIAAQEAIAKAEG